MPIAVPVRLDIEDCVGIVTIDNPPVNALGPAVSDGIVAAVGRCNADSRVAAIVLIGAGRAFSAGADIKQFGKPRTRAPIGARSSDMIELSDKPVVAALHGFAVGGGLEEALACHYRIAKRGTRLAQLEIRTGVLPGGGGTQRLPRLIGVQAALDMILGGQEIDAERAVRMGLVDSVVDGDLREAAIAFARRVAGIRPLPRVRDRTIAAEAGLAECAATRSKLAKRTPGGVLPAPLNCIAAVEAACLEPFDAGLRTERRLFDELENSPQAAALRYAFFAERAAAAPQGLPKETPVQQVKSAAVVGAGLMGTGIAMCFAAAGIPVRLLDVTPEALGRGISRVHAAWRQAAKRGRMSESELERRMGCIQPAGSYDDIASCEVVIEAAFEEIDLKRRIFARLDASMPEGALLFSTTGDLDIDVLAAATRRPEAVAGTHFFSPANAMPLLEVVRGSASSGATLASAMALGRRLGKVSVLSGNADGFVANRSRMPFNTELGVLIEEGATPEQIDRVMIAFGYPMGPCAVADVIGLDLTRASRLRQAAKSPGYRHLPIPDRLVELGRLGVKSGAGWYRYESDSRQPISDPEVTAIVRAVVAERRLVQREISDDEILQRLLLASVNMGCRIISDGIVQRASDIDAMWLNGFGFPRHRGGLMYWADSIGVDRICSRIEQWQATYGDRWAPAPLLREVAARGGKLAEVVGAELP